MKYDCYFVVNNKWWQLFLIKDNGVRKVTFFKLSLFFKTALFRFLIFYFLLVIILLTKLLCKQIHRFKHCHLSIFWGYWIIFWQELLFTDETNVPESLTNGIKVFSKIQFKECEQNSDLNKVESPYWDKNYTTNIQKTIFLKNC